jgi:hypothetical protein
MGRARPDDIASSARKGTLTGTYVPCTVHLDECGELEPHAASTSFGFNRKGRSALANTGRQDESKEPARQWNSRFERDVPIDLGSTGLINDAYITTVVLDGQTRNDRVGLMTRGVAQPGLVRE